MQAILEGRLNCDGTMVGQVVVLVEKGEAMYLRQLSLVVGEEQQVDGGDLSHLVQWR